MPVPLLDQLDCMEADVKSNGYVGQDAKTKILGKIDELKAAIIEAGLE